MKSAVITLEILGATVQATRGPGFVLPPPPPPPPPPRSKLMQMLPFAELKFP